MIGNDFPLLFPSRDFEDLRHDVESDCVLVLLFLFGDTAGMTERSVPGRSKFCSRGNDGEGNEGRTKVDVDELRRIGPLGADGGEDR